MPTTAESRAAVIMERCDDLAEFTEEPGRITRRYGTTALAAARDRIETWMTGAGLSTRIDPVGNLIGRYDADGSVSDPETLILGGHFDSVRDAGRYDGILGVLAGIAIVARLHAERRRLPFAVEVIGYADEEGLRFHSTFLGSTPMAGAWDRAWLDFTDDDDVTLAEAMRGFEVDPDRIGDASRAGERFLGFIETHIEQGPVLEARDLPVGVVSGITGSMRAEIAFDGMAGHAGTVPMALRRDALTAISELVLTIERIAREHGELVATVGQLDVQPNAPNVIPGRAVATLDLRHPDATTRGRAAESIRIAATAIAAERNVTLTWHDIPGFTETPGDPALIDHLTNAIAAEGIDPVTLPSGAGHDAVPMSCIAPVAMLFVRCKDGISHNPAESIVAGDVAVALRVLDRVIDDLAER